MTKRRAHKIALVWVLIPALVAIPLLRLAYATIKPPGAIAYPTDQKIFVNGYALCDGSGSYDPQGYSIDKYTWDFGDATTYTETAVSAPDGIFDGETKHQYTYSYVFSVTLTVENSEEGTDTDTQSVQVASKLDPPSNIDGSTVDLSWQNANHSALFSKYEVHKSTTPDFTPDSGTKVTDITTMATTTYEVTGLSAGTTYYFQIKTVFTDAVFVVSNEVSATTVTGKRIVRFSYDKVGHMTKMADSRDGGTSFEDLTYAYDPVGNLTKVTYPDSRTVSYAYDKTGRRTKMVDPAGNAVAFLYSATGRLTKVSKGGAAHATYYYDKAGVRTKLVLGNNSYALYEYDTAGRLTKLSNKKSDNTVISSFAYAVDKTGNRTKMTLANGNVITYGYDSAYQLTRDLRKDDQAATLYDIAFHYDLAGNRTKQVHAEGATTTTVYYYDVGNKLTKSAGAVTTTYTYDGNGSLTKQDDGTVSKTFGYTAFGLMDSFGDGTNTATYKHFGNTWLRSQTTVNGTVTKFYYDSDDVAAEADSTTITATYVTPFLDQNVSMTRGGSTYHYVQDGLGCVRELLDGDEALQNAYDYRAFGEYRETSSWNVANAYTYTGRETDSGSGLRFYRWRMYDPALGRFVSRDPIGHAGGFNMYVYVGNRPPDFRDPFGLWWPWKKKIDWGHGKKSKGNCFRFACNDPRKPDEPHNSFPGGWDQRPFGFGRVTCEKLRKLAMDSEYGEGMVDVIAETGKCPKCYTKVAYAVENRSRQRPDNDYHWYRQRPDGNWEHKRGSGPVSDKDGAGKTIVDPEKSNRNFGNGNYDEFCGYLCVKDNTDLDRTGGR